MQFIIYLYNSFFSAIMWLLTLGYNTKLTGTFRYLAFFVILVFFIYAMCHRLLVAVGLLIDKEGTKKYLKEKGKTMADYDYENYGVPHPHEDWDKTGGRDLGIGTAGTKGLSKSQQPTDNSKK